jgi:lipid A disaccharide synthetase
VNLVADQEIVPEMLQERASAAELAAQLRPLLDPASSRAVAQRQGLTVVRQRLGQPGASTRVVALANELLAPCG